MKLTLTKLEQETLNDIVKNEGGRWGSAELMSDGKDCVWTSFWAKPTKGFNSRGYDQHVITKPEWFSGTGRQWSGVMSSLVGKVFFDIAVLNEGCPLDAIVQVSWTQEGIQYLKETFGDLHSIFEY